MSLQEFKANEVIFKEGAPGESMFIISEGTVGIYLKYGESDEQKIKTLHENQIFGEMAVIEYYPRSATAVALSDTKLIEVKSGQMSDYFKSHPDKIIQVMKQLSMRIRELTLDYDEVTKLVAQLKEASNEGKKNPSLLENLKGFIKSANKKNNGEISSVESMRQVGAVSHSSGFTLNVESYPKGTVIFKEGDPGKCMYDIHYGKIGIYKDYGKADEVLLTTLSDNKFFGEMAMLDDDKRSATAVVISDEPATVECITTGDLIDLFENNPPKVEMILAHMSSRLRKLTKEYLKACDLFYEFYTAETWDDTLQKKAESFSVEYYD